MVLYSTCIVNSSFEIYNLGNIFTTSHPLTELLLNYVGSCTVAEASQVS